MMIIDVRKLNAQKRYEGSVEFDYQADEQFNEVPLSKFAGPVKIVANYVLYEDDSLELKGKLCYTLVGSCSRCLQDAKVDVEGEIDALFEPVKDAEDYSYQGGKIDLTDAINDAIMASMPRVLSCGESCKGIDHLLNK